MICKNRPPAYEKFTRTSTKKQASLNDGKVVGRPDLNRRPPAPKAGGIVKTTLLFSTLPLKQNNLVVILACGWLCAPVPICLLGGHKSWHNRDVALTLVCHTGTRSSSR